MRCEHKIVCIMNICFCALHESKKRIGFRLDSLDGKTTCFIVRSTGFACPYIQLNVVHGKICLLVNVLICSLCRIRRAFAYFVVMQKTKILGSKSDFA